MRKFKFFLDYNQEEEWLNYMANKGYELVNISFGYNFKITKSQKANIRIDYRIFKSQKDFIDYCTLFEDIGWQHIAGRKKSGTQYFKKNRETANNDIFSDDSSKAGRYKRLSEAWLNIILMYTTIMIIFINSDAINVNVMRNPKLLYLTPGLWETNGIEFWIKFLFETPFALMRASWLIIPLFLIVYSYLYLKARYLYRGSCEIR